MPRKDMAIERIENGLVAPLAHGAGQVVGQAVAQQPFPAPSADALLERNRQHQLDDVAERHRLAALGLEQHGDRAGAGLGTT